ncbi:MAG TPA: hypothetical protein VMG10_32380, partial [Gemmataceae bacterium]|nr:hypothetical protein [Gemmataceae bacterium]
AVLLGFGASLHQAGGGLLEASSPIDREHTESEISEASVGQTAFAGPRLLHAALVTRPVSGGHCGGLTLVRLALRFTLRRLPMRSSRCSDRKQTISAEAFLFSLGEHRYGCAPACRFSSPLPAISGTTPNQAIILDCIRGLAFPFPQPFERPKSSHRSAD